MAMSCRLAELADVDSIIKLTGELGYGIDHATVELSLGQLNRTPVFVALEGGQVVGWVQVCLQTTLEGGTRALINGLVVTAEARGRGIGKTLVRQAQEWARLQRVKTLRVRTNAIRQESAQFYRNFGFTEKKRQIVFDLDLT